MRALSYSVPGVYRQATGRQPSFPRVRSDVAGFVGVAGAARLYQATPLDDWLSYELIFLRDARGRTLPPPAGSRLADCVRAFFANGGSRCWVVNVAASIDGSQRQELLTDLLGLPRLGAPAVDSDGGEVRFTGLELLLQQDEVAIAAIPELDATLVSSEPVQVPLPPISGQARFGCCDGFNSTAPGMATAMGAETPLYSPPEILQAQSLFVERLALEPWRAFGILSPPRGTGLDDVLRWKTALPAASVAGLYWPWLRVQTVPGAPVLLQAPIGFAAGIFARRDRALGPQASPANESVTGAVGLEVDVSEHGQGLLTDGGVNPLRIFSGAGVQLWGARTLLFDDPVQSPVEPLSFVGARRALSAIERTVTVLGSRATFEPNTALLRANLAQSIVGYLLSVYEAGAFAGGTADSSFTVKCDAANNPASSIEQGRLICDVGVALAAPAEFIVFRFGRADGVVELQEGVS